SIVSVSAPRGGAAASYVRERLTNLRTAMLLELGTTTGAVTGAFLAGFVGHGLFVIFGAVLALVAVGVLRRVAVAVVGGDAAAAARQRRPGAARRLGRPAAAARQLLRRGGRRRGGLP